jgi:methionyl-tRNA formyltransferase
VTDGRAGGSRVRTVFLGSGGFGVESLRRLAVHPEIELVGVVTAPARPAGRRQEPAPTAIETTARELGHPVLTPDRLRDPASTAAVLALEPDLLVLADYGQIVPAGLLELRHGAVNLHPSLLPRHRGATPIPAAILAGDALDTGPIVDQERVRLDGSETAPALEERLATVAADLLERDVGPWIRGQLTPRAQPADGATLTRPLRREDGRLDPARSAVDLERQVRAYQPWPGSFIDAPGGRLIVLAAEVIPGRVDDRDGPPTTFTDDDGDGIALATPDSRLRLVEVQPAGGRRMTGAAFRRGLRVPWPEWLRASLP